MADPKYQNDVVKQIQLAWDEAQAQLSLLRDQVEHATAVAQAKVQGNLMERELDRSYRDLGEAVWAEVSKGKLTLPGNLGPVKKALEAVTNRIQAQNASINDLLEEGADLAKKLQQRMNKPKPVAPGSKKR